MTGAPRAGHHARAATTVTGTLVARTAATVAATLVATALALAGCAPATPADPASGPGTGSATTLSGDITVFAAASLQSTFTDLADSFEAEHPGTTVALNFAGSTDLVTQIIEGAPADVFAPADTRTMTRLTDAELAAGRPVHFATNTLVIAVPRGNPAGIASFSDLAKPGLKLVVCAPEVPCGRAAQAAAATAGVRLAPVSEESSVTDVLGKVSSREADAGLVYRTDVAAASAASASPAVEGIGFEQAGSSSNTYPIVAVAGSPSAEVAQAFVEFVAGPAGQGVLRAAGFGAP